jgi:hypothetical protein
MSQELYAAVNMTFTNHGREVCQQIITETSGRYMTQCIMIDVPVFLRSPLSPSSEIFVII